MLNEVLRQLRRYDMLQPGDTVVCAVSGGADSMALLWAMYLLKDKLGISLEAAHFNHGLRGAESDRDEQFVREFCDRYDIPLHIGRRQVRPGKKGLEAAAREARYAYFDTLPGKLATAHTADDNAETVLLHLVRGTGLKGLGGIAPVMGRRIRPMLTVTRQQVLALLEEYHISYVTDSSNETDAFLRNRLRHHVMPLLRRENPKLAENLSDMAMRLRLDEEALTAQTDRSMPEVKELRAMHPALRSRMLEKCLKENGVREPEAAHIALLEQLVFSRNPSARAEFPGDVTIGRCYEKLVVLEKERQQEMVELPLEGTVKLPWLGMQVTVAEATDINNTSSVFTVCPEGQLVLRFRQSGDALRLSGGKKSLKKIADRPKDPGSPTAKPAGDRGQPGASGGAFDWRGSGPGGKRVAGGADRDKILGRERITGGNCYGQRYSGDTHFTGADSGQNRRTWSDSVPGLCG